MPVELAAPLTVARRVGRRARALPALALAVTACACGAAVPPDSGGGLVAVGAENEYANVIAQIGGRYVAVSAVESNPNTDPHAFEASPSVASLVGRARLVVQNGAGYDTYMNRIEAASPSSSRRVIDVQRLLGLPDSTPNPHLWYSPRTMPAVARAVAADLSAMQPGHARYFDANLAAFDRSLTRWYRALRQLRDSHPGTPVATTEPVGDYMLAAAGADILTPFTLQAAIMNGLDPAPQSIGLQEQLLARRRVEALLYNQQVTDTLTQTFLSEATRHHVPVVGLYETMPAGYDYQGWMLAETEALRRAITAGVSTQRL